jgi:hypothetical protein
MTLYCTNKLLAQWGISPDKCISKPSQSFMGDWTATYFIFDDRLIYLFVNNATLFSFVLKDIDLKNIEYEFKSGVSDALHRAGISFESIGKITKENKNIVFAKNTDRRILGSMNNLVSLYQYTMSQHRSFDTVNMSEVESKMLKVPFKFLSYKQPVEMLKERLKIENNI